MGFGQVTLFGEEFPELMAYLPTHLNRCLSTGIYVEPSKIQSFHELLNVNTPNLKIRMAAKQMSERTALNYLLKLNEALVYSLEHGYGLLEASDVYESEPKKYP